MPHLSLAGRYQKTPPGCPSHARFGTSADPGLHAPACLRCSVEPSRRSAQWAKTASRFACLILTPFTFSALAAMPTQAPVEITAAAPQGTTLLAFKSSGSADGADAAAVYETAPDTNGVRYRTLTLFRRAAGHFVPEVTNAKVIACSKCSQFHDDPFYTNHLKVAPNHIQIEQMDGGEKPSTTTLNFVWRQGAWRVTGATRFTIYMGRYESTTRRLPLPPSGLVKDMDASWSVPMYLNTLVINQKAHKFMFLHGDLSQKSVKKGMADECHGKDCKIVVQQHDGCIALVLDASKRLFSGSTSNPKASSDAISEAMGACHTANGVACEAIRTDCSVGILSGDE